MSIIAIFQRMIFVFVMLGSFHVAMGSSLMEWEGEYDSEPENSSPSQGFVDDTNIPIPDNVGPDIVEVTMSPKRQMQTHQSKSDSGLALVPVAAASVNNIKDETATTGENAKKCMPMSLRNETTQNPYMYSISQVTDRIYN